MATGAGNKSLPATREYRTNYDQAMDRHVPPTWREPGTEPCEHCGRVPKWADQRCACTLRRRR